MNVLVGEPRHLGLPKVLIPLAPVRWEFHLWIGITGAERTVDYTGSLLLGLLQVTEKSVP